MIDHCFCHFSVGWICPSPPPKPIPQVNYHDHMQVRRVNYHGDIRYLGKRLFTTESLGGEYVGIKQADEDIRHSK